MSRLDSLSDVIAFGVAPALIMFLWSLKEVPRYGWIFALALAVCMALRLARFNSQVDDAEQPRRSAGFLTGVPAPAAAGLAMLPLYISLWANDGPLRVPALVEVVRNPWLVAPWLAFVAFLAVSNIATFSWSSLRIRRSVRIEALCADRFDWRCLVVRALGNADPDLCRLPRFDRMVGAQLCAGQAAARSTGAAKPRPRGDHLRTALICAYVE